MSAPQYDTHKSREEYIKKLEGLMKQRDDRKQFREAYRIYKAGIKEDLLQDVKALEEVKEAVKAENLPVETILKKYENLGLLDHREGNLPEAWILKRKFKDELPIFEINKNPVVIDIDQNTIRLEYHKQEYPLNDEMIGLLMGRDINRVSSEETLRSYFDLMNTAKVPQNHKRFRMLVNKLSPGASLPTSRMPTDLTSTAPTTRTSKKGHRADSSRDTTLPTEREEEMKELEEADDFNEALNYFLWSFIKDYNQTNIRSSHTDRFQAAYARAAFFFKRNSMFSESIRDHVLEHFQQFFKPDDFTEEDMKKYYPSPKYGTGLGTSIVKFLPDDPYELFERLKILIAAKKEGHNKVFNEKHAILKRLLEKKFITKEQYKLLAHA